MDIIVPKTPYMELNVRGFQVDTKTGLYVPNTYFEDKNTIQTALKAYLAYKIGTDTTDRALDNRFTYEGPASGASSMDGYDGIAYESAGDLAYLYVTSINQGGDNSTSYIEFEGYLVADAGTGDINTGTNSMVLGHDYNHGAAPDFTTEFSRYSCALNITQGRTDYFYWRITMT